MFLKSAPSGHPIDLTTTPVRADEPTRAQAEAGNYAKRALPWRGLTIRIENEAGSVRRGTDPGGKAWETHMPHPYGYIVESMGVDGDPVDVYVGPFAETAEQVFVVHQRRVGDWEKFDEDKAFIGFLNADDARQAFLQCYDDPRFLGPITAMPAAEFVEKVRATKKAPRMIKARVGPYIRLGRLVNLAGYDGRQARAQAAAGQAALFSDDEEPAPAPKKADLARHDHTNQSDLFGHEDAYHGIETREGTQQSQVDAGEAALRDFARHLFGVRSDREQAPSVLGARLFKGFKEAGGVRLIGQQCASPSDLAAIAQIYRDPRFETFRAVFVRDGEVIGESAYSSRVPGAVYLPEKFDAQIASDMKDLGADGYYMLHNHPAGHAQPSNADCRLTTATAALAPGFLGHVVIDHKEYAAIEADGAYQVIQAPDLMGADFHSSPTVNHALLGSKVSSPKDVALVAKALQANGELNNPVLVLTKGQYSEVDLLTSFPKALLPAPKSHKAAVKAKAWLRRVGRRTGAGALAFLVVSEKHMQDRSTMESLIRSGIVTDVVDSTGFSLRNSGIHPATGDGIWEPSRRAQRVLFRKPAAPVRQTDTPQFREWFGASKVTRDGEPLRMYHASYRDFDQFDRRKSVEWRRMETMDTVGSWFSDSPAKEGGAGMYASGEGAVIYPVYLSIQNPKYYASFDEFLNDMHIAAGRDPDKQNPKGRGTTEELRAKLKSEGYDGIRFGKTYNKQVWQRAAQLQQRVKEAKEAELAAPKADRARFTARREKAEGELRQLRRRLDTASSTEFDDQEVWVAFDPHQIKSAIGNNGDFSKDSPVITKSMPILFLKAKLKGDDRTVDMFSTHVETRTRKDGHVQKYHVANAKKDVALDAAISHLKEDARQDDMPAHERKEDRALVAKLEEARGASNDTAARRKAALAVLGDGWKNAPDGKKDAYKRSVKLADGGRYEVMIRPARTVAGDFYVGSYFHGGKRSGPGNAVDHPKTLEEAKAVADSWISKLEAAPTSAPAEDLEKFIKVAADSIGQLRKIDVLRVLESNGSRQKQLANYITEKRPDLAKEVAECMEDIGVKDWRAAPRVTSARQIT